MKTGIINKPTSVHAEIWLDEMGQERQVFTTGQIAKLAKVAPRTVSKWFDSGILKGWRIPGSEDRRISRQNYLDFCREYNIPLIGYVEHVSIAVITIGCNPPVTMPAKGKAYHYADFFRCYNEFDPLTISHKIVVIADAAIARQLTQQFYNSLKDRTPGKLMRLYLLGDMPNDEIAYSKESRDVTDCFQTYEIDRLQTEIDTFAGDNKTLLAVAKRYKRQSKKQPTPTASGLGD